MAEPDKQYTGDGGDNYADAARKTAEAAKQIGQASAQKVAAAGGTAAGAEATANAAAATVQASVEGGKAVAEIATGTAAGGPWGAILAAAWAMRHTLFKVLIAICLSLLFIIVMVVSLPSIIFNGIFHTDPATVDPAGSTEMFAIYEEMSAAVSGCVTAGYDHARAEVERIITEGGYDYALSSEATVDYGRVSADYDVCYILAAYSASLEQKGTSKADMKRKMDAAASRMFPVTYEVKETTITVPPASEGAESTTETVSYVQCTIHPFDASMILFAFGIDPDATYGQFQLRTGDAIENMAIALKRTLYGTMANGTVPPLTDAELIEFLNGLTCSPARKELMRIALSLVGRVPYFWGGKSASGWNNEWNTPKLVTSAGSSSTGTLRPYGLDCSGYTDWVYKTALGVSLYGGATWSQWDTSEAITEAELLPGDLGFLDAPGAVAVNHVLLYAGTDASGKKLWVHCSSSAGGVALNSPTYVKYYRRVKDVDLETMVVPAPAADPVGG
jgi:cell wall-associated NlpC family hydrolase